MCTCYSVFLNYYLLNIYEGRYAIIHVMFFALFKFNPRHEISDIQPNMSTTRTNNDNDRKKIEKENI
jgi:hypothetical protein